MGREGTPPIKLLEALLPYGSFMRVYLLTIYQTVKGFEVLELKSMQGLADLEPTTARAWGCLGSFCFGSCILGASDLVGLQLGDSRQNSQR